MKRLVRYPEFWLIALVGMIGLVQFLQQLQASPQALLRQYWPVLFVLIGIFQIFSPRYRDPFSSAVLILIGSALLLFHSGLITAEALAQEWPALLKEFLTTIIDSIHLKIPFFRGA